MTSPLDMGAPTAAPTLVEWGLAGWDDTDDVVDLGLTEPDGMTIVRVQLLRGRRPGMTQKDGEAGGVRILALLDSRFTVPPTKGTRVVVAIPGGDIRTPGNALVIGAVAKSSQRLDVARAVLALPDHDLEIIPKSTVTVGAALSAQFVALSNKVDAWMSEIRTKYNGHTHGGPAAVPLIADQGPTGASALKAS